MTSKEKLLNILKNYKLADKGNGDFLSDKYQEKLLNPIFKDLEILEILKHCFKYDNDFIMFLKKFMLQDVITFEELIMIKEWIMK